MKVYVLMYHGCSDYEECMSCDVFGLLSDAQKQMEKEYNNEVEEYKRMFAEEDVVRSCKPRFCAVYEMGDYSRNHSEWEIVEKNVK